MWQRACFALSTTLILAFVLTVSGCSSSGGGDKGQPETGDSLATTATLPASAPLALLADVPSNTAIYVDLPDDFDLGQLVALAIDLTETLSGLSVARTDGGISPDPTVKFEVLVASGDERGVACSGGTRALEATITGTGNGNTDFSSMSVSSEASAMPQAALDVINAGSFTLCASVLPSVDASVTLSGLAMSFGFDDVCEDPQGIDGVWSGDYTCNDCMGGPAMEADTVELRITQLGDTAIYQDDSGATYLGNVCGSSFHHLGLGNGYIEYGTFTRTGPVSAVKSSTWVSTIGPGGGCCEDALTFSPN